MTDRPENIYINFHIVSARLDFFFSEYFSQPILLLLLLLLVYYSHHRHHEQRQLRVSAFFFEIVFTRLVYLGQRNFWKIHRMVNNSVFILSNNSKQRPRNVFEMRQKVSWYESNRIHMY